MHQSILQAEYCFTHTHCVSALQTWQRMRRRHKKLSGWENKHVLKCDLDDAAVRKAKQKRRAPPVPSVNQLAWSCDDMLVYHHCSSVCLLSPLTHCTQSGGLPWFCLLSICFCLPAKDHCSCSTSTSLYVCFHILSLLRLYPLEIVSELCPCLSMQSCVSDRLLHFIGDAQTPQDGSHVCVPGHMMGAAGHVHKHHLTITHSLSPSLQERFPLLHSCFRLVVFTFKD